MKRTAVLTVLCFLPFFAPRCRAQAPAPSPGCSEQCPPPPAVVATFLGFSQPQLQQFEVLLTQFKTGVQGLQAQIAPRQQQLDSLLSQPNPNPAQIGVLTLEIHSLQQQLAQVIQGYQTAFASILTQDQKQKVELITAASQVQPAVGAFVALHLVPPPSLPCQKP